MAAEDGRPSWDEHADGLRGDQRALAMLRALTDPDPAPLDAAVEDLAELIDGDDDGPDLAALEAYQVALARLAIRFGRELHGERLDDHLAAMQVQVAAHVAEYRPDDDEGSEG